ncbi:methylated-DNA--[protein]-cysteine S-methyltransferase [Cellulomonas bogoriensis]|uniref:Methylated-DNA--protein-cysteine methyltransferase n=1 Tax=Cellulomonas bogoriensis 69B4 = DSM 16987 TaxID=1386082 RepID=A0A0A0BML7_9CELL|nr:methylated-DNA--[protein]-cysteine S-methyltransferase [Cellulomonas bogoriensis]KGM09196.1 cysteine methyltransferase [Cellulomonas bogoriensis 69B4 = DSM 16987]
MTATSVRTRAHTVIDSPLGPLTLVAEGEVLVGLYMTGQRHLPPTTTLGERRDGVLPDVAAQLAEYFEGRRTTFDVSLDLRGTPFQVRVWTALRDIPYGEQVSYGELARRVGSPGASRAVGLANGRNPVGIVVPCHRVVGATGRLTGYGGGLDRKLHLLDLERATSPVARLF